MKIALIVINHFKEAWNRLSEDAQAEFAARIRDKAEEVGVRPVVGYKLSTPGAVMDIWEADNRQLLDAFKNQLDVLGYKTYFDYVLMYGTREAEWLHE